ncbi:MAG TPA: MATE family efflux transporter [Gemmatimonadaceae bacterium]|nr:MATE family efflux transporter [Gemmatimonadaceae bacterium]
MITGSRGIPPAEGEAIATGDASLGQPTVSSAPPPSPPPSPPPPQRRRYDRSLIEGPLPAAVWKLAWPTMLANVIGGAQGIVDQVLVGHMVGFTGNAAIGVSSQIFLVVIIFLMSLFTGMSVLVSRFAGAGDEDKVNRAVYQAFLTTVGIWFLVLAPAGYFLAPSLLRLVNAAPEVQVEALPYLRIMFVFGWGMMIYFMLAGALRSAGDARTPMVLGIALTLLNIAFNVVLIAGLGPVPSFGTAGAAMGTSTATGLLAIYALVKLWRGDWVVQFPRVRRMLRPDWGIIRALFRFGLPSGVQGIAMNVAGVILLAFIGSLAQSAAAQAAYSVSYGQLFSLITWTSQGLMGAVAAVAGQSLGAHKADRAEQSAHVAARVAVAGAAFFGLFFFFFPRALLAVFGMNQPAVVEIGTQLLRVLSFSGLFIAVALTYTGGLQGTGDTKSPLYISIVSQIVVPLGICFVIQQTGTLHPLEIWIAILIGHVTRCLLSVLRFNQGKWRDIAVDIGARTGG